MYKKILTLGLFCLFLPINTGQSQAETEKNITPVLATQLQELVIEGTEEKNSSARFASLLFGPLGDWQDIHDKIATKKFNLKVTGEKNFPEQTNLTKLQKNLEEQNNQVSTLTSQINDFEGKTDLSDTESTSLKNIVLSLQKLEKSVSTNKALETDLVATQKVFATKKITDLSDIRTKIIDLETQADVQIQLLKTQVFRVIKDIAVLIGMILFLLFTRWIITRFIKKFCSNVKQDRVETILFITKVTVNILITFIIFGLLFAQFVNILPFVALVATGFAFALKDSISSFLAWFLIGTENGYRVGDVVKVNDTYGRVKEITPFITVLRERFDEAESGKICTFPNKYIFEHEIKNYSRFYNFKQCRMTFYLSQQSDYKKAKQILCTIIEQSNAQNTQDLRRVDKRISRHFKLDPNDLRPYIWVQQDGANMRLEAKFFLKFKDHNLTKHAIEEKFIDVCFSDKTINFKAQ